MTTTAATDLERRAISATASVTFPPASWSKRFCRDMRARMANGAELELTEKQRAALWSTVHRFRRQIQDADVRAEAQRRHDAAPTPEVA